MPIYYYSPISPYLSWSINLDFYDIGLPDDQHQFYEKNLFDIWATVMTEEETIKARFDPAFKKHYEEGKAVKGIFDSAFGTLFLSSDDIHRLYNASTAKHDNPSIFLAIEKDNNFKSNFSYMGLEVSIYSDFKTGGNNSIPEGIYLNGKVSTKADRKLIYRLQLDKDKPYIRIEYSSNSDLVNFALTSNIHNEYNDYFENLEKRICIKSLDDVGVSSSNAICELGNNRIVVGCFDIIKIINIETLIIENELRAHEIWINCLSLTPDGLLFSGDSEGVLVFWKISGEGKKIFSTKKESAIKTIDVLGNDKIAVGLLNSCMDIIKYK